MKGCLKLSAHPGSPCISPTPSSSSTLDGSTTDPSAAASTTSFATSSASHSGLNTPPTSRSRKCVDFGKEICAQFFVADEWDRTPTEPARKLSYQDLLELKEIQRSLPRANQPPDDYAGRAAKCYLRAVPIGLLPLLPDSNPTTPLSTPAGTPTIEPARNPLSASNSPVGSGTSSPMRDASPERGDCGGASTGSTSTPNSPWCVNFHRVRAPPPPVAPAYAPSACADTSASASSSLGSRFPKFPYPPSPLHRGATPPRAEPVQDKRLAHLPPARQAPPRKRPTFAFLPLLDDGAGMPAQVGDQAQDAVPEKKDEAKEAKKAADVVEKKSTPTPLIVLSSTRDASREREEDAAAQVEPEWPRHAYGSSKSTSPKPPTSFKKPAPSDAGRYHGGFGSGYAGYVPPPPVRMVAASGLGVPIKKSLTAHAASPATANADDAAKANDEGAWYGSHAHPYSPGSSRTGSVAGSRSASVERGGERERRLYAPHATFAAALLRVDELVQRAAVDTDTDEASDGGDSFVDAVAAGAAAEEDERGGRSEKKIVRKTARRAAKKEKNEKRFIMVNDMQIEVDESDDEAAANPDAALDDDVDVDGDAADSAHAEVGAELADSHMSLKAALEAPATPPTVYAYQLPTPTPTPPPVLSAATATPVAAMGSPMKLPTPASTPSSCLLGETAGPPAAVAAATDIEPVRATTPTPINVMAPIRFKRAVQKC